MDIIICKIGNGPIKFYCGPGQWSAEYPDAFIYTNAVTAKKMVSNLTDPGVMVVGDYGLDSETIL